MRQEVKQQKQTMAQFFKKVDKCGLYQQLQKCEKIWQSIIMNNSKEGSDNKISKEQKNIYLNKKDIQSHIQKLRKKPNNQKSHLSSKQAKDNNHDYPNNENLINKPIEFQIKINKIREQISLQNFNSFNQNEIKQSISHREYKQTQKIFHLNKIKNFNQLVREVQHVNDDRKLSRKGIEKLVNVLLEQKCKLSQNNQNNLYQRQQVNQADGDNNVQQNQFLPFQAIQIDGKEINQPIQDGTNFSSNPAFKKISNKDSLLVLDNQQHEQEQTSSFPLTQRQINVQEKKLSVLSQLKLKKQERSEQNYPNTKQLNYHIKKSYKNHNKNLHQHNRNQNQNQQSLTQVKNKCKAYKNLHNNIKNNNNNSTLLTQRQSSYAKTNKLKTSYSIIKNTSSCQNIKNIKNIKNKQNSFNKLDQSIMNLQRNHKNHKKKMLKIILETIQQQRQSQLITKQPLKNISYSSQLSKININGNKLTRTLKFQYEIDQKNQKFSFSQANLLKFCQQNGINDMQQIKKIHNAINKGYSILTLHIK